MQLIGLGATGHVWDVRGELPDLNTPDRYNFRPRMLGDVKTIVVHHWASRTYSPTAGQPEELTALQGIRSLWQQRDEYHNTAGFPYHYAVFPSGRAYYCGDVATSRAHVAKHNLETIGVSLAGNFMAVAPGAIQLDGLFKLVANLRYAMGSLLPVVPHKSYGDTSCPGDTWDHWGPAIQKAGG